MGPRDQTKKEVVDEIFTNAHNARKVSGNPYVIKADAKKEKKATAKEMGIEG